MSVRKRSRANSSDIEELSSPSKKRVELNGELKIKVCTVRLKPLSRNEVNQHKLSPDNGNGLVEIPPKVIKKEICLVNDLKEELLQKDNQVKALQQQLDKEKSRYNALVESSRKQQLKNSQMIAKQREEIESLIKANTELKNLLKDLTEKNQILNSTPPPPAPKSILKKKKKNPNSKTTKINHAKSDELEPAIVTNEPKNSDNSSSQVQPDDILIPTVINIDIDPEIKIKSETLEETTTDEPNMFQGELDFGIPVQDLLFPEIDYAELTRVPLYVPKPDIFNMENAQTLQQDTVNVNVNVPQLQERLQEVSDVNTTSEQFLTSSTLKETTTTQNSQFGTDGTEQLSTLTTLEVQTPPPQILENGVGCGGQEEQQQQQPSVPRKDINPGCYECHRCAYYTYVKEQFDIHSKQHTNARNRKGGGVVQEKKSIGGLTCFECNKCDYVTHRKSNFIKHQKIHGVELPPLIDVKVKTEPTESFSEIMISEPKLKSPLKKLFKCHHCDYVCSKKYNFSIHKCAETMKRSYKCTLCQHACKSNADLIKHLRTHTGEKPFMCDECDFRSAFKCNLVVHKRNHTGERPYRCDCCGNTFKQKSDLNKHHKLKHAVKPPSTVVTIVTTEVPVNEIPFDHHELAADTAEISYNGNLI